MIVPRISEIYNLSGNQGSFDFIDVQAVGDTPLFIDPSVIASIDSPWANECTSGIQSFFQTVLDYIRSGDHSHAKSLLRHLGEDNSTRLGYSSQSEGSGLGPGLATKFYEELSSSRAVQSGLIGDIEDTALMIEGIREDRISDVTTNIIRKQLVDYTQEAARFYSIPLIPNVATPSFWDGHLLRWQQGTFDLPVAGGSPLLLVPKSVVRRVLHCNPSEYYRHYVLEFFKSDEISMRSPITFALKSGGRSVYKKDVEAKYRDKHKSGPKNPGVEKRINLDASEKNPDLLRQFRNDKVQHPPAAIGHEDVALVTGTDAPDLEALLGNVTSLAGGREAADQYEKAIEALLTALFYPHIVNPKRQRNIHDGRKRIDITYTNMARNGFFEWLSRNYPAANVLVECKNYTRNLANPEYDQIGGRFSPSRGKYGLIVYRKCENKDKVMLSLRDTAMDDRGYITALDDDDLADLVQEALSDEGCAAIGGLLHTRFEALTS